MTITDLLHSILQRLDLNSSEALIVTADEAQHWPADGLDLLINWGLLTPTKPRTHLLCDGCEEQCIMPVEVIPKSGSKHKRAFIACDKREDIDIVPVEFSRLRQWRIDPNQWAALLARLLDTNQTPQILIQNRLWGLGKAHIAGSRREAFLGRGLNWSDADLIAKKLDQLASVEMCILSATELKFENALASRVIIPLPQALLVDQDRLLLDLELIAAFLPQKAKKKFPVTGKVTAKDISSNFRHSPDFRSVSLNNVEYILTSKQAQVIQILFEAYRKNPPDVGTAYILSEIDSVGNRVRDVFKQNLEAWKALIISNRKGTVRLNL